MELKDKIAQRRREREVESVHKENIERKVARDKLQEKWEVTQIFNNASQEQKEQLIRDSLCIFNGFETELTSTNPNISRERAEFFLEAAANQTTQSWFRALIIGGLVVSVYIGFSNSWLLAVVIACVLIMAFGSLAIVVVKITKANMIERHRLEIAAQMHLQTDKP